MIELSENLASLWSTARELEQAMETSGLEAVEGRRFLLRMLAASVDIFVENNDVDRPTFEHAESPSRKMFADCPDTDYLSAPIATGAGRVYRLSGRIPPGTLYVGVLLYGRGGRIGNRLTDRDLNLDADGRFELFISTEEQSGTWLRADGDETTLMVRQYFSNRATQAPIDVSIEFMGEKRPPGPLDAKHLAKQVGAAERMLKAIFERTLFAHQMASSAGSNVIMQIPEDRLFPTPDNTYRVARFAMNGARSLVLRGKLPVARYFSVTLYNAWLESYDYQRHRISLNHDQIECEADGSFSITIASRQADGPNQLDTAGHDEGYVVIRALLLDGDMPPFELGPLVTP
ncbi:MAG: DUF1214 domain-containing protein [Acidobacteriota bacterium]